MNFQELQGRLRTQIRDRIEGGELTGIALSRAAGFQPAHLSNFLSGRRGLSLEAMDRLLAGLELEIADLMEPEDLRPAISPASAAGLQRVALVSPEVAARVPRPPPGHRAGSLMFQSAFLRRLRPNDVCRRRDWLRFVVLRLKGESARSLQPQPLPAAAVLVDRHYTSLQPLRRSQPNLYAARVNASLVIGEVRLAGDYLVVRPRNPQRSLELVRIERPRAYADCIIGRVCQLLMET